MALKIGITGGIGSGKSIICRIFNVLGIPTFDADRETKVLMETDADLMAALIANFGAQVYDEEGRLQRGYLAEQVFGDQSRLELLNRLVHPVAIRAGEEWAAAASMSGKAPYTVKEAALLFESGSYRLNDFNILVTAPVETRIRRVMKRDGASREQVEARIRKQMPDEEKEKLADFIILNDGQTAVLPQVLALHRRFIEPSAAGVAPDPDQI